MIYYPNALIDEWIMEDVNQGDLTTRILAIGNQQGSIRFSLKNGGRASGVPAAEQVLRRLGIAVTYQAVSGTDLRAGENLLCGQGKAAALHQAWKIGQNILEWSCGVAEYTAGMVKAAKAVNPQIQIAATRKNIPGTKLLALGAVLDGGGIIHRGGTAETILLFENHRNFLDWKPTPDQWEKTICRLKREAPEKKIIVEAGTIEEAFMALSAAPDIIQLDKFSPDEVRQIVEYKHKQPFQCLLSIAGGITIDNARTYAETGVDFMVSSAPYYAPPADVKVVIDRSNEQRKT